MSSPIYYGINSAVVAFLFHAGLWFTGVIINGPNFHTKLTLAAPTIGYRRIMLRLMLTGPVRLCWRLDRPGRTPSCCAAWQLQHCLKRIWNASSSILHFIRCLYDYVITNCDISCTIFLLFVNSNKIKSKYLLKRMECKFLHFVFHTFHNTSTPYPSLECPILHTFKITLLLIIYLLFTQECIVKIG